MEKYDIDMTWEHHNHIGNNNHGSGILWLPGLYLQHKVTHHVPLFHTEINCGSSRLHVLAVQLKGLLIAAPRPAPITCHLPVKVSKESENTAKAWV